MMNMIPTGLVTGKGTMPEFRTPPRAEERLAASAEADRADKPASVGSDGCARVTAASGLPRG